MANGILYIEYESYELEGVPPYVSHFIPVDRRQRIWVDVREPRRYRSETYFRTREASRRDGVENYETGTGNGGNAKRCSIYEGKTECIQSPITDTLTFDGWLKLTTRLGQKMVERKDSPTANENFVYKGVKSDTVWGDAYLFERQTTITSIDTTRERPAVETSIFDTKLLRQIEWRRTLIEGDKQTLYALDRLKTWKMLDPATVPPDLFNPERVASGKFDP